MNDPEGAPLISDPNRFLRVTIVVIAAMMIFPSLLVLGQGIPIRRASPVVSGQITVQNTSLKIGQIPGILYGTNPGCRYFFVVKNNGSKAFNGKVEISLLSGYGSNTAPDKTFDLIIQAGQQQTVSIDSQSMPALGNTGTVTGFRFVALSVAAEGSASLSGNLDTLVPGE